MDKEESKKKVELLADEATNSKLIPLLREGVSLVDNEHKQKIAEIIGQAFREGYHLGISCGRYVKYEPNKETSI